VVVVFGAKSIEGFCVCYIVVFCAVYFKTCICLKRSPTEEFDSSYLWETRLIELPLECLLDLTFIDVGTTVTIFFLKRGLLLLSSVWVESVIVCWLYIVC